MFNPVWNTADHIVSRSFEPMNKARGMSYSIWPDLDSLVATWLDTLIDSSIRIKIKVGKWMEEQFSKGRKVVMDRQKQQLPTKTKILLSFGRMNQSSQIWSFFGELKTKSFETIKLRTELSGNYKYQRTLIWMILILLNYNDLLFECLSGFYNNQMAPKSGLLFFF